MSFEDEQEANAHRFDKDGESIFDKTYLLNDLKLSPIANYEVDEHCRVAITEIFGHFFVYVNLDEMGFEVFLDEEEAEKKAQMIVADQISMHMGDD